MGVTLEQEACRCSSSTNRAKPL